jgi:DNA-binding LytR/AlgR family response regulator
MNVLIADDEPLALGLIEDYVSRVPGLHLAGKAHNALEAFSILNKQQVDVIFLDIQMPEITGMEFLKMLKDPPFIVFTTAYTSYAAESYNHNAVDYLVKPVTFERFMKAVDKLRALQPGDKEQEEILFARSEGKMIRIVPDKLYFVEGYRNYVRLWTADDRIMLHSTMKNVEEQLVKHQSFLRVHRSYIVNLKHISELTANTIRIGQTDITIGATFRDHVLSAIGKYRKL